MALQAVGPESDVVIIVDVLWLCTCVDIALTQNADVLPYRDAEESVSLWAAERQAILANRQRISDAYSLSPASLQSIPAGIRLVLPSPNGATLCLAAATG